MTTETPVITNALDPAGAVAKARRYLIDNEDAMVPMTPLSGLEALFDVYHAIDGSTYEVVPGTMEFLATLGAGLARAARAQHHDINEILFRASPQYRDQCLRSLELAELDRQTERDET